VNRRKRKKLQQRLVSAAGWDEPPGAVPALLAAGADPNGPDRHGTTPLYRASVQGAARNVEVLLAAGAAPNVESGTGEEGLPLCGASVWGHLDAVRALLAGDADANLREDHGTGHTASEHAVRGGHRATLRLLRAAGATSPPEGTEAAWLLATTGRAEPYEGWQD
jgi:ankyrin repeat protein